MWARGRASGSRRRGWGSFPGEKSREEKNENETSKKTQKKNSFFSTKKKIKTNNSAGGTHRLPRAVGLARAKELILSCRRVAAAEALSIGLAEFGAVKSSEEEEKGGENAAFSYSSTLLDASAPHGAADAAALALARSMALAAPLAARAAKAAVSGAAAENAAAAPAAGRLEAACYFPLLSTWDRDEGLRAFAEKRPPRFRGE